MRLKKPALAQRRSKSGKDNRVRCRTQARLASQGVDLVHKFARRAKG